MDAETDGQVEPILGVETGIEDAEGLDHLYPGPDSALGIVFMCLRIAKIDQQPIPEILGNMATVTLNHLRARGLIGADDYPQVFRIKLTGERGGIHEVA